MAEKFRPPILPVGATIQWYRTLTDANAEVNPCCAFITRNDGNSVCCITFPPDTAGGYSKTGARYYADPDAHPHHEKSGSGWWREIPDRGPQITAIRDLLSGKTAKQLTAAQGTIEVVTGASAPGETK